MNATFCFLARAAARPASGVRCAEHGTARLGIALRPAAAWTTTPPLAPRPTLFSHSSLAWRKVPCNLRSSRSVFRGATCAAASDSTVKLAVEGMMCGGCVSSVTAALEGHPGVKISMYGQQTRALQQGHPGVKSVKVSLETSIAEVELKDSSDKDSAVAALCKAVSEAGFEAKSA
eukprot:CAMPEP_0117692582 /NCGR_PEP_ID=MMETSP0804-20121206/26407_1 /TAXON_ID=1074897 /ORGANISM="Tetraselmis astigmatica, Strain CCMP880" /LENGTH=174 /DNA_ID=CAMNT_0005506045 /DNA_START=65 /DNA_END=590 /DNA_ORIENTATION=-